MSFERLVAAFLDQNRRRGLSGSTLYLWQRWLGVFVAWCSEHGLESPLWVQPQHLDDFRNHLLWTPNARGRFYSPNSIDQALRAMRACLRWAVEQGWLMLDPTRDLVLGRPIQPRQPILSPSELRTLLELPDPETPAGLRDRALLALFYYLPASTFQAARVDVGDLVGGRLVLEGEAHDLDGDLAARLRRYLEAGRPELGLEPGETAFFLGRNGRRLGATRLGQIVRFAGTAAGLRGEVSPRTLRRSYASHIEAFQDRRFPS